MGTLVGRHATGNAGQLSLAVPLDCVLLLAHLGRRGIVGSKSVADGRAAERPAARRTVCCSSSVQRRTMHGGGSPQAPMAEKEVRYDSEWHGDFVEVQKVQSL